MSHEQEGPLKPSVDSKKLILQLHARDRVDRSERFIQKHNLRIHCQRPGQPHTLLLAAGQLGGIPVFELLRQESHQVKKLIHPIVGLFLIPVKQFGNHGNVIRYGHVGKKTDLLYDVTDPSAHLYHIHRGYVLAKQKYLSACRLI